MNKTPPTKGKVREYVRPVPSNWWTKRRNYTIYVLREMGSGLLAVYAVLLVLMLKFAPNPTQFQNFLDLTKSPLFLGLHLLVFLAAVLNSITAFNLTPKVIRVFQGDHKVDDRVISGVHYLAWGAVSVVLFVLAWKI